MGSTENCDEQNISFWGLELKAKKCLYGVIVLMACYRAEA